MIFQHLFKDHPRSVGETYLEHQRYAFNFGGTMVLAGIACILHGLIPSVFVRTGSRTVTQLYERMSVRRNVAATADQARQQTVALLQRQ